MYFADIAPSLVGQTTDGVLNVQFVLSHNGRSRRAQQLVVVQQRTGNRVFYRHQSDNGRVALDVLKHLLKRGATDYLQLLALKLLMGRNVVKRPQNALYGYSFHLLSL